MTLDHGRRVLTATLSAAVGLWCVLPAVVMAAQSDQALIAAPADMTSAPRPDTEVRRSLQVAEASKSAASPRLGSGDKLNLKVYERIDLSGDLIVRPDGTVSLPLLGAFLAEGRLVAELEQDIADALEKVTGRASNLILDVVEWRPIFVVGAVDKPGTYPFRAQMTVLQAMATAGGPYRLTAVGGRLEASREELTHRQNVERLKTLLARRARLAAELEGASEISVPKRLSEIATSADVAAAVNAEQRLMSNRAAAAVEAVNTADRNVEIARRELQSLKEQLTHAEEQVRLAHIDLKGSQGLAEKGLTSRTRLLDSQRLVASLEANVSALTGAIARGELALAGAEKLQATLDIDRRLKLEEEAKAADDELRTLEMSVALSGQLTGLGPAGVAAEVKLKYQIIRRTDGKQVTLDVDETGELLPGDVVRVSAVR